MRSREVRRAIIAFSATCLSLVASFLMLLHGHWLDNNADFTKAVHNSVNNDGVTDICICMNRSIIWADEDIIGAQYDCTVYNNSDKILNDWELKIDMPKHAEIGSIWNGKYYHDEDGVVLIPDSEIATIPPHGEKSFGIVLHSPKLIAITDFIMDGRFSTHIWMYEFFWVWCFLVLTWIIFIVAYVISYAKVRNYNKRLKKDAAIITQTFKTFANLIDAKDSYTQGHSMRVADYASAIAKRMKLPERQIEELGYIALMHDCGKIGVPDEILNKPGALTEEERKLINEHTVKGGTILENFTAIKGIRQGALYHHERFDGNGYPEGLKGKDIPLYARIIGVADAFDAMNSNRVYRKSLPQKVILGELRKCSGTQFDPDIVKHMIQMLEEGCYGFEVWDEK